MHELCTILNWWPCIYKQPQTISETWLDGCVYTYAYICCVAVRRLSLKPVLFPMNNNKIPVRYSNSHELPAQETLGLYTSLMDFTH